MKCVVTGAGGFIGSHMTDLLLSQGHEVVGVDNFSTGQREFLEAAGKSPRFRLYEVDLFSAEKVLDIFLREKPESVFHFASNADIRFGLNHPRIDLEQGTLVTHHVLEASRQSGVKKFVFTSTAAVYGEPTVFPTPENCPFPVQTSLYAANKLASEGLVQAYAVGYGIQSVIFRLVSFVGDRYPHGHVFDFVNQLQKHPEYLKVLGDGTQRKSYLHVRDGVRAISHVFENMKTPVDVFNIGPDEYIRLNESIGFICEAMKLRPELRYTGGERGWIGDSPFVFLNCEKLKKTGWRSQFSTRQAIEATVGYLRENPWLLARRKVEA